MTANPEISAIICTCDRHDLLPEAIESILRQTLGAVELIVVDNSADQAAAAAFGKRCETEAKLRYICEPVQGLSNARNKGAALARGQIVAFMDDDAVAAPDWAEKLVLAFDAFGGKAGCVGGRIVPRWLAPRPSWLDSELLRYLSVVDWGGSVRELKEDEWLAGCNIAFDRETLLAAGGFSTNLGRHGNGPMLLSNEEIAVCKKIKEAGKRAVYAPDAVVEHLIGAERLTQNWFLRRAAWQAVSDFTLSPLASRRKAVLAYFWLKSCRRFSTNPALFDEADNSRDLKRKMNRVYWRTRGELRVSPSPADLEQMMQESGSLKMLLGGV